MNYITAISENVPQRVFSDEVKLGQILVNILSNAIKYTQSGFVKVKTEAIRRNATGFINIIVQDSGKGIQNLEQIGQWFHNLDIVDNVNQHGLGFGINISKRLIAKLGGNLIIENNSNLGNGLFQGTHITIGKPERLTLAEFPYIRRTLEESKEIEEVGPLEYLENDSFLDVRSPESLPMIDDEFRSEESMILSKIVDHTEKEAKTLL